ncbi:lipoprotein [Mycoplasma capricolum]|uniref:lipoprotein n=1 Tax=Mycoplasma capricolum TaxID=2095 RepID=UPI0034DB0C44
MKKLLNILVTTAIIITTSFLVIACKASKQIDIKITNPNNVEKNEEKSKNEKIENIEDSKKEEKNKQNDQYKNNQANQPIHTEQPKEKEYVFKRSKKENFELIKKYGLKLVDSIFQKPEKDEKLKSNPVLSTLIRKITSLYSTIAQYKNIEEFESKLLPKSANEALYREFDEAVTNYEKEENNIWKLLN